MREQIQARLNELKRQFELGQAELQQLQAREDYLHETMLRISGAMQVLEEMLAESQVAEQSGIDHLQAKPLEAEIELPKEKDHV